jgi:hypothetical protein
VFDVGKVSGAASTSRDRLRHEPTSSGQTANRPATRSSRLRARCMRSMSTRIWLETRLPTPSQPVTWSPVENPPRALSPLLRPRPAANSHKRRLGQHPGHTIGPRGPGRAPRRDGAMILSRGKRAATATRERRHLAGVELQGRRAGPHIVKHRAERARDLAHGRRTWRQERSGIGGRLHPLWGSHELIGRKGLAPTVRPRAGGLVVAHISSSTARVWRHESRRHPLGRVRFGPGAGLRERVGPRHAHPKPGCAWLWSRAAW